MNDDLTTSLELPASARAMDRARRHYRSAMYEVRHPENHKQLVRFLCVGVSGYLINFASFAVLLHAVGLDYKLAFCGAFVVASTNNFFWNRRWTFKAHHEHPGRQAVRFFSVNMLVALCAYLILTGLVHTIHVDKVIANGISWIIVTPLSFVVQKLWSFKA